MKSFFEKKKKEKQEEQKDKWCGCYGAKDAYLRIRKAQNGNLELHRKLPGPSGINKLELVPSVWQMKTDGKRISLKDNSQAFVMDKNGNHDHIYLTNYMWAESGKEYKLAFRWKRISELVCQKQFDGAKDQKFEYLNER